MLEEITRDEVNSFFVQAFGEEKASVAQKAFEANFTLNSAKLKKQVIDEVKNELISKDLLQAEFKASKAEFRQELKQATSDLRDELKQEINDLRAEVKQEINDLRAEVKDDIAEIRLEMSDLKIELKDTIMKTQATTLKWVAGIQIASLSVVVAAIGILIAIFKF